MGRAKGIVAPGPKPNTSKPAPWRSGTDRVPRSYGHKIYPYLLRGLKIERPNCVGRAGITCIPIGRGFLSLVAVMDWAELTRGSAGRRPVAWPTEGSRAKREIFNTDQGSHFTGRDFTGRDFTGVLLEAGIQVSMDGCGRWLDNVFIERRGVP